MINIRGFVTFSISDGITSQFGNSPIRRIHSDVFRYFIQGHIVCVGCPKLDPVDYSQKLTAILSRNKIKSVKIVRMEVPCCGGLEMAAKKALQASGKFIPWQVVTISRDGRILDE